MAWEHLFKFLHEIRHTPSLRFLQSQAPPRHPFQLLGSHSSGQALGLWVPSPGKEGGVSEGSSFTLCALHPLIRPGDEFWRSGLCQSGRLFFSLSGSAMHRDGYMYGAEMKTQGTSQPADGQHMMRTTIASSELIHRSRQSATTTCS
jgi:hypothetical protein